jgi:hypothetical protein
MSSKVLYNADLAEKTALRDGATLLDVPKSVNRESTISFRCGGKNGISCDKPGTKSFRSCYEAGMYCKSCIYSLRIKKQKHTIEVKYNGVHFNSRPDSIPDEIDPDELCLRQRRDEIVRSLKIPNEHTRITHFKYKNYAATLDGKVYNLSKNREVGFDVDGGYRRVMVSKSPRITMMIHRFMWECLIGNELPLEYDVDHKDTNTSNNAFENLQLLTRKEHVTKTAKDNPHIGPSAGKVNSKSIQYTDSGGTTFIYNSKKEACDKLGISNMMINRSLKTNKADSDGRLWSIPQQIEITNRQWKTVPGLNGVEASSDGYIRNMTGNSDPRKGSIHKASGYYNIKVNGKNYKSHQLICMAFHDLPPTDQHTVDHIDRNRLNNSADNLRWATSTEQNLNRSCNISVKTRKN